VRGASPPTPIPCQAGGLGAPCPNVVVCRMLKFLILTLIYRGPNGPDNRFLFSPLPIRPLFYGVQQQRRPGESFRSPWAPSFYIRKNCSFFPEPRISEYPPVQLGPTASILAIPYLPLNRVRRHLAPTRRRAMSHPSVDLDFNALIDNPNTKGKPLPAPP